MVGYIGSTEQAAVALANSFYVLALVFGLGISTGITPLVAIADGEKNNASMAELLKSGFTVNILTGLLLFIVLFFCSPLFKLMDQSERVADLAIPFFNVMIFSIIPLSIFSSFKQFAEGLSDTKTAMVISVGANLLNVVLNYIFIFGKMGFEPMGLMGACWASFWARIMMALFMFLYVYYNKRFKQYWKNFNLNISYSLAKNILSIGIPSGLQWVFEIGAFAFAVIMIGWIGEKEQAAHQIAISIAAVTYMIASGLSAAASVRVGNQVGKKDIHEIRAAGFSALILAVCFMLLAALTFILGRNYFPILFSIDEEVIGIASSLLIIAALFQLSDGIQVVALGALRGLKDVTIPTVIAIVSYWIIGIPTCYFLAFKLDMGVRGVWYGLFLALSITAVSLFIRFNLVSKKFGK
jgi:MATE family multidrug resistance protein